MPGLAPDRRAASRRATLLLIGALLALPCRAEVPQRPELLVFAAASLTDALGELASRWEAASGTRVKLSFAASSLLARQIEAGGRADLFISADQEWMDYLAVLASRWPMRCVAAGYPSPIRTPCPPAATLTLRWSRWARGSR
jgi:molybdate transport system substrate-binding protein